MKPPSPDKPDDSRKSIFARIASGLNSIRTRSFRDLRWGFLDQWEKRRGLRWSVYGGLILALICGALVWGAYPWWTKRNAVRITQQWLQSGKLHEAAIAAQLAIDKAPHVAESWVLAAEVARRSNDKRRALYASGIAAGLAPENSTIVLTWASDALLSDQPNVAQRALDILPDEVLASSAWGQRIAGEIDRRSHNRKSAREHFEKAIALEGPVAVNEFPLATLLISSPDPAEQQQGVTLFRKWITDPDWGAPALRSLLAHALRQGDKNHLLEWAERLRAHPQCTLADIPNCLRGLSEADESKFQAVIATMMRQHDATATDAAQLIGWLNQIGRSPEAVQWIHRLPAKLTHTLPLSPIIAETFRINGDWSELLTWTKSGNWGSNLETLRTAYALHAAIETHETAQSVSLWNTLQRLAEADSGRALFVANVIYSWGMEDQAVTVLWGAAKQPGHSIEALGTLARHYQVNRDADGQYRVFTQLYNLRSNDPAIANNYAFFSLLTGNALIRAGGIARDNFQRFSDNDNYRATYTFALTMNEEYGQARAVIQSIARRWPQSPAIAFAYGLLLADTGEKEQARRILHSLDPAALTRAEVDLIQSALD